ncbi:MULTISPECIES: tRNA lysidine(34) synthetase TilS [Clostridia]|jgi:tRNA(Ile)-lysidine synthase|uniref:tRNA(Ile)-lysidine synthase n=1 Tax=Ruminococcus hominis TaxID=2763065 RepID=A0ABR7GC96_9FIRM|nr:MULTISPECIES: tRNA lysidine(34) synthetase TilS [Clostridia]MBC5684708.1 tRNA lysidine(34) synthetase TilS [Ruminococcus hominis]RGH39915.1 tRNA lysidine(34) synthetase TilS [Firmicutes bacterium AM41-5BH]RKQ28515.1 tRNA lysidine(34) synthetase TilS [Ruminococcus sp. B05]TAP32472.1 tRNA lysidine(34) synthetase TilS [Mediterraneibacter sp. gm002]
MKRIEKFIQKYHMLTCGDKVIAGVSGGADSVCLFLMLLELREKIGFDLIAVHVHHGLRGEAADQDQRFVEALCEQHRIPLEIFRVNLESIAKKRKQSLEEAGRMVRREAFDSVCQKYGGNKIALAHHQNDNAETLLWNLSRGTGLDGLGGIRPVNGKFIRPLLCMNRKEIEEYLSKRKQSYCIDETNAGTDYTRNKLRHLVLPILEEQVNSAAVRHMNETMEQIWELQEYMQEQVEAAYQECVQEHSEKACWIQIQQNSFETFPELIKKMVIRKGMEQVGGKKRDLSHKHVDVMMELMNKQVGRTLDLPYEMHAKRNYEGIRLEKRRTYSSGEEKKAEIMQECMSELNIPGEIILADRNLKVRCKILEKPKNLSIKDIPQKIYTKWFDYDIIKSSLYIRTRQAGDNIVIDEKGHQKKLKSWFVDEKIPKEVRDSQLLLAENNDILWVLGHRMSQAYQVKQSTKWILQIEVETYKSDGGKENGRNNSRVSI